MKKVKRIIESSKTTVQFELGSKFYLGQFIGEERAELLEIIKQKGKDSFKCTVEESKALRFTYNKGW